MPELVPEFDQYVEYVTEGAEGPEIHPVALGQLPLSALLSLEVLADGYAQMAAFGRSVTLDAGTLSSVQTAAAAEYHADVITHEMINTNPAVIVDRLIWVLDRPLWAVSQPVTAGQVWFYAGNLYRCVQSHVTQSDWLPTVTPALWVRYYDLGVIPVWVQPVGGSDAYALGAKVTHAGHTWQSTIPANVWQPGSVGAETLWTDLTPPPVTPNWITAHVYVGDNVAGTGNGDVVIYTPNQRRYRCRQSHTSIPTWNPPAVASLWLDLGPV